MSGQIDPFVMKKLISEALSEDVGTGDITTLSCVASDAVSKGNFIAKETGVVCGIELLTKVFAMIDEHVRVTPRFKRR